MSSNLYLVCYDLNSPGQDYSELYEEIKSYGYWWHHLDSTWIIKSPKSAKEIRNHLKEFIDSNDELLIVKFGESWAGKGFSKRGFDWLHNNAYE
ncbi:hypothetical protein PP182_03265 [Maribacter sp. PR1]|uniref:SinR family protein n=1 Tax=Maribacter cobaltidurans TaxID=1178778 RepID=A0ABU7IQB9_9FLAO|nr:MULTISPECIES: hypothetical protein [Maribacter]MDC6387685.1 hypothetical protein [Maribacter sp. PR1]MEE1975074.1 hypothetical protein [Maribacter cobaltidurans]